MLDDVIHGRVSEESARKYYGICIKGSQLDVKETISLRKGKKKLGRKAKNLFTFGAEREAFEKRWPPKTRDYLNTLLYQAPLGIRYELRRDVILALREEREGSTDFENDGEADLSPISENWHDRL